jgi:hypothetical protein
MTTVHCWWLCLEFSQFTRSSRHSHVGGNLNALLLKLRLLVFRVKMPSQAEDDGRSLLVAVSGV